MKGMRYGEQIAEFWRENGDRINKKRSKQHLYTPLTLEDMLKEGYRAYVEFSYACGKKPTKTYVEFLRTEVI